MLAADQRDHLLAEQPDVLGEGVDLLQRAVVQVESEPDEEPLVRLGEPGLGDGRRGRLGQCAHGETGQADSTVSAATRPVRYAYRAASVRLEMPSLR